MQRIRAYKNKEIQRKKEAISHNPKTIHQIKYQPI